MCTARKSRNVFLWQQTTPDAVKTVVNHLLTEVKGALVTVHLDTLLCKSPFPVAGEGWDESYFIRMSEKKGRLSGSCEIHKSENTLNLYIKLFDLEPKENKFQLYMKSVDKIWELLLKDGAKLAVFKDMKVQTSDLQQI